jgi:hypothetical protein
MFGLFIIILKQPLEDAVPVVNAEWEHAKVKVEHLLKLCR